MRIPEVLYPVFYAVLRVLTAGISPVPAAVMIDPLPILLARDTRKWTRLCYLPGLIAGDILAGIGLGPLLARVFVVALISLLPTEGGFHRRAWLWTFQFALVTGIAVDLRGMYPLGFVTLAGVVQGFCWWGLLAPKAGGGKLFPLGPLLFPPLALLGVHLILPTSPLWKLPSMGETSSGWGVAFSMLVLLEPVFWWVGHHWTEWDIVGCLPSLVKRRNRLES